MYRETGLIVEFRHIPRSVFLVKDALQNASSWIIRKHAGLVEPVDSHVEVSSLHNAFLIISNADSVALLFVVIWLSELFVLVKVLAIDFDVKDHLSYPESHIDVPESVPTRVLNCLRIQLLESFPNEIWDSRLR